MAQAKSAKLRWLISCRNPAVCNSIGVLPENLGKLAHVEQYLRARHNQLMVLDDMQRLPILFEPLRGLIDHARRQHVHDKRVGCTGLYLLPGSASLDLR